MFQRVILTLFIASIYSAQNNLIIFSSGTNYFSVSCKELLLKDTFQHEIKIDSISIDTLHLTITLQNNKTILKSTVFLMEKGKPVTHKEFVYALQQDEVGKFKLVFISSNAIKPLPKPLLPEKPKEDTTYKWRNNVYGNVFELKDGKPIFYNNTSKGGSCSKSITEENLKYCLQLINRTAIEPEKFNFVALILKNNCFACSQAIQILNTLNYELDKLKLIKLIYPQLVDKTNFKVLRSSLNFESSQKQFDDILQNPSLLNQKNKISCFKAVNDSVVLVIADNLKLLSTDYDKYEFMKEKFYNECYSSVQFKGIMNLMIHDREKLDLIKLFYHNICDKENLNTITDVFSYKQTISDFQLFLSDPN